MSTDNPTPVRKRRHIFRWFFLAVQAIFLIWIITGATSAAHSSCNGLSHEACTTAKQVGGGIGVLVIIFVWLAVDVVLALTWLVFGRRR